MGPAIFSPRVCNPSTSRMVIWPDASRNVPQHQLAIDGQRRWFPAPEQALCEPRRANLVPLTDPAPFARRAPLIDPISALGIEVLLHPLPRNENHALLDEALADDTQPPRALQALRLHGDALQVFVGTGDPTFDVVITPEPGNDGGVAAAIAAR